MRIRPDRRTFDLKGIQMRLGPFNQTRWKLRRVGQTNQKEHGAIGADMRMLGRLAIGIDCHDNRLRAYAKNDLARDSGLSPGCRHGLTGTRDQQGKHNGENAS